jgi:hypothetical protein
MDFHEGREEKTKFNMGKGIVGCFIENREIDTMLLIGSLRIPKKLYIGDFARLGRNTILFDAAYATMSGRFEPKVKFFTRLSKRVMRRHRRVNDLRCDMLIGSNVDSKNVRKVPFSEQ